MRRLVAAFTFLTRLRIPGNWNLGASDVGRSAAFFPLVGAAIGAVQGGLLLTASYLSHWVERRTGHPHVLPVSVLAVLLVAAGVLITGSLHLDGLADMADGFGGGRSRDDVLRIMRDHAIGTYGTVALILVLSLKISSIVTLIEHGVAFRFLVIAPALARASVVVLGSMLPYARADEDGLGATVQHFGLFEVLFSSLTAIALAIFLVGWRGCAAVGVAAVISSWNARLSQRKIQGITGDTLGANVEVCEVLILVVGAFLTW